MKERKTLVILVCLDVVQMVMFGFMPHANWEEISLRQEQLYHAGNEEKEKMHMACNVCVYTLPFSANSKQNNLLYIVHLNLTLCSSMVLLHLHRIT